MSIIDKIRNFIRREGRSIYIGNRAIVSLSRSSLQPFEGSASIFLGDGEKRCDQVLRATVVGPRASVGASMRIGGRGDTPVSCSVQLGLFSIYVSSEHRLARRFAGWVKRRRPKGLHFNLSAYRLDGEFIVSGHRGRNDDFPELYIVINRVLFGSERFTKLASPASEREIHLAEGSYTVRFTPIEAVLKRPRWPFAKRFRMVDWEVVSGAGGRDGIPIPGKGENSWDCDEDAAFSGSMPAATIEEAIGKLVGDILRDRTRRSGTSWVPERGPAEPAPTISIAPN